MRIGKFLVGLILVLGVIYIILAILSEPVPDHPFFEPEDDVLVIAHQGGNNLWPDNTL